MENKPSIPQEVKERIITIYWGQTVLQYMTYDCIVINAANLLHMSTVNYHLLLFPLSMITDEDAMELYNILRMDPEFFPKRDFKDRIATGGIAEIYLLDFYMRLSEAIDYLRSRSYAWDAFGYTVEQLVEGGIYKLKTS